jgi:flagellar hook-associated protein 2
MAMRLSGLASGMDTESIVSELMKVQRLKSTKIENKITTTQWKQEKWKTLNTKLYSFYTGPLSKIKMQGSFNVKAATSSNDSKVSVSANTNAPEGTHLLKVKELASAQFVTGAKLETDKYGKAVTTSTKLMDLGFDAAEGTTVTIGVGGKNTTLDIGTSTTVNDFVSALKNAGLNASFDTTQKRFFISSKESGTENAFSITTASSESTQDRNAIRDYLKYGTLNTTYQNTVDNSLKAYTDSISTAADKTAARTKLLEIKHAQVRDDYKKAYIANADNITATTESERIRLEAELADGETLDEAVLKKAVDTKLAADAEIKATEEYTAWKSGTATATNVFEVAETGLDALLTNYATNNGTTVTHNNNLSLLKLDEIVKNSDGTVTSDETNIVLVKASNATYIYNGVEMTSASNNVSVNGLNLTLKGVTAGLDTVDTSDDETISLGISNNKQAVYDMVKSFVKTYNELITEMNENYYAASSKGFDPLTDEEKETMSDDQIEKWEDKIKTSLLRRDDTLNSLLSNMRSTLNENVKVNGKSYSLSSFGIGSTNYTEKGLLHINGDTDDSLVSGKNNDLMKALSEDPDTVMAVLNTLGDKLYSTLTENMSSNSMRSAFTLYNDKEMTKTVTGYKADLKKLEEKLQDMEDRYYKQFAAMETAMAKMNSQSSSLASMLGTNNSQ